MLENKYFTYEFVDFCSDFCTQFYDCELTEALHEITNDELRTGGPLRGTVRVPLIELDIEEETLSIYTDTAEEPYVLKSELVLKRIT